MALNYPNYAYMMLLKRLVNKPRFSGWFIFYKYKGLFGCDLEALDLVQNRVDLELQSDSEATVWLNSSST